MKVWVMTLGIVAAIAWQLLTFRPTMAAILLFGFLFLLPSFRNFHRLYLIFIISAFVFPFLYLQITIDNVPGSPRIVGPCNSMDYMMGHEQDLEDARNGKCVISDSDVRLPYEVIPRWYLVW